MASEDPVATAKNAVSLVGDVIKLAADNADARAAGGQLGKAALTLTKTINNALLPIAAVNFAFDKAREYFSDRFGPDLAEKVASVPPDQITEPKASIAGPALQGLAFAHEEHDLKEMYLSLLASSMDKRAAATAHPAFVEMIRQLEAKEARLLRGILNVASGIAVAEIRRLKEGESGWVTLQRHLANLQRDGQPHEDPQFPAMVDNWIRLGLVHISYDKFLTDDALYSWVEARPEFARHREAQAALGFKVTFQKGVLWRTALGGQFATAVGIIAISPHQAEETPK